MTYVVLVEEHVVVLLNECSEEEDEDVELKRIFFTTSKEAAEAFCEKGNKEWEAKRDARLWFQPWEEYSFRNAEDLPANP